MTMATRTLLEHTALRVDPELGDGFDGVNEPSQQMRIRRGRVNVRHFSPRSFALSVLRGVPLPTPSLVRSTAFVVRIEVSTRPAPATPEPESSPRFTYVRSLTKPNTSCLPNVFGRPRRVDAD